MELPDLSLDVADELERLRKNMDTDFKHTKELSELIKIKFTKKNEYSRTYSGKFEQRPYREFVYSGVFSNAYHLTYSETLPKPDFEKMKPYMLEISHKLNIPSSLKDKELKKLEKFCLNLYLYSAAYEKELRSMRGSCFLVAA